MFGGLAATQAIGILSLSSSEWRREFDLDFLRFKALTETEFFELVSSHAEIPVPLSLDQFTEEGPLTYRFSLPDKAQVYLSFSAENAEAPFVHPLIAQLENGRRYLLPLVRSTHEGRRIRGDIHLGHFDSGDHSFTLQQDASVSLPIPGSLRLNASRPAGDSLLAAFTDHNAVVKLKNTANVLDDIPLTSVCKIHKRESLYRVTSYIIFSSENGGKMPATLLKRYNRTVDIEWVMQQIFHSSGDVIAERRRFQRRGHASEQFRSRNQLGNSPVLSTATPNNTFSDDRIHLWRWSIPNPFAADVEESIYYAPKSVFLPPDVWATDIPEAYPELQEWGLIELALEGCVDHRDRTDPEAAAFESDLEFAEQHLRVSYPSRGCRTRLRLPRDPASPTTGPSTR